MVLNMPYKERMDFARDQRTAGLMSVEQILRLNYVWNCPKVRTRNDGQSFGPEPHPRVASDRALKSEPDLAPMPCHF